MRALALLLIISACSSKPQKRFEKLLAQNKCEEASLNIPNFHLSRVKSEVETITSTTAGYTMIGAAYGVDVVYMITAGIIFPAISCFPLGMGAQYGASTELAEACAVYLHNLTQKYDKNGNRINYGAKVSKNTEQMRCPKLDWAIEPILKVAECFERNNQKSKALHQLINLKDPQALGGCIDETRLKDIEKRIQVLEIKG